MSKVLVARDELLGLAATPRVLNSKEEVVGELLGAISAALSAGYEGQHVRAVLTKIGVEMDEATFERYLRAARARSSSPVGAK